MNPDATSATTALNATNAVGQWRSAKRAVLRRDERVLRCHGVGAPGREHACGADTQSAAYLAA